MTRTVFEEEVSSVLVDSCCCCSFQAFCFGYVCCLHSTKVLTLQSGDSLKRRPISSVIFLFYQLFIFMSCCNYIILPQSHRAVSGHLLCVHELYLVEVLVPHHGGAPDHPQLGVLL